MDFLLPRLPTNRARWRYIVGLLAATPRISKRPLKACEVLRPTRRRSVEPSAAYDITSFDSGRAAAVSSRPNAPDFRVTIAPEREVTLRADLNTIRTGSCRPTISPAAPPHNYARPHS